MKVLALLLVVCVGVASSLASISTAKPVTVNKRIANVRFRTALDTTASVVGDGGSEPAAPAVVKSSMATSTFNLAKSIIGCGILSLPSGVGFLADEPSALIPASIGCAVFGAVAAYAFSTIGRLCKETNSATFQEAWEKTVNPKSAVLISTSITALCFLASLAYSIILGDSFSSLFQTFNFPAWISARQNTILWLSTLVLFPLCSLKSLAALAPFSLLGLGGTLFTAAFMTVRYLDKSYLEGGKFFADIALKPSFSKRGGYSVASLQAFVLLSMLSTAFVAHYNAPSFMNELEDASVPRFNKVVKGGFSASIAMSIFVMAVGFLTFGGSSAGFVLNNYSGKDLFATASRFAIGIALITSYPFTFSGLREGIFDFCKLKGNAREKAFFPLTVMGLGLLTALAIAVKDVSFVVSLSGAMFGCAVMFVIPAIMNISQIKKTAKNKGQALTKSNKTTIAGNWLMMLTGIVMGAIGVAISIMRELGKI
mmetsp:Transcript_29859/g.49928  ORF Transcript_29859/g.49928 Transcript_29859/m.49928 type:complete len:483 (+) Transcript_29859:119-1567(+)